MTLPGRRVPDGVVPAAAAAVAVAVLALWAGDAADRVTAAVSARPTPMSPYRESQWWLAYDAGFVRRGLPGEVLTWLAGGPPDRRTVALAGTALSLCAAAAVVGLGGRLAGRAPSRSAGLLAAAVVVTSPLTVSLLLQDVGRYDGVGVLALAALALPPQRLRQPTWVAVAGSAGVLVVATAAQELLLPALAPAALARAGALRRHPGRAVAVLAPGTGVAVVSAAVPPSAGALARAREAAEAAGRVRPGGWGDALDAVERSAVQNLSFFTHVEPAAIVTSLALWAGFYAATAATLAPLLARGSDRTWWALVAWQAGVALVLCGLGVDFRRWWALALLGLVAAGALTGPGGAAVDARLRLPLVAAVTVLLAGGLWAADLPVVPVVAFD